MQIPANAAASRIDSPFGFMGDFALATMVARINRKKTIYVGRVAVNHVFNEFKGVVPAFY